MAGSQSVVYVARNLAQAHLVQDQLRDVGIGAHVINEFVTGVTDIGFDWAVAPRVVVDSEDAAAARLLVEAFEDRMHKRPGLTVLQPADLLEMPEQPQVWPACTACGAPRRAKCPACGEVGQHFDLVLVPPDDPVPPEDGDETESADLRLRIICHLCDTQFEPQLLSECECGAVYAEGVPRQPEGDMQWNGRVAIVLFGSLAILGALVAAWEMLIR